MRESKAESSEVLCSLKKDLTVTYKNQDLISNSRCSLKRSLEEKSCEERPGKCECQPARVSFLGYEDVPGM